MGDAYTVCSIAGAGIPGHFDGNRKKCSMNCPSGIALDQQEGIWIADRHNHCIRRLPGPDEKTIPGREQDLTTVTGRPKKPGFRNGRLREASFNGPAGICCGDEGKMYVVDRENHCVRCISGGAMDGWVTSACGSEASESGWRDGDIQQALFNRPFGIASSAGRAYFIADTGNNSIRKLDMIKSTVTTVLGAGRELRTGEQPLLTPMGVCVDGSNCLYVSEWGAHRIRRVSPDGSSVVVAGGGAKGHQDGRGSSVQLFHPCGMDVDSRGNVFIADYGNHCVRRMTPSGEVMSIGRGGIVIVDDGERYVSSTLGCLDGAGTFAAFNSPQDVAVDSYGDIYVADWGNHCVRKIEAVS